MDSVRSWLLGLVGTACVCAAAMAAAPEGGGKKVLRFVCALAMLISMLSIVRAFDYAAFALSLAGVREEAQALTDEAVNAGRTRTRAVIESRCEAYILGRAEELGAVLSVHVTARWDEAGFWVPESAQLEGSATDEARLALVRTMESELGIPYARQNWSTDESG